MTIVYTGRKAALTRSLKEFTEKRLAKLSRFLGEIEDAHVILKLERHRHLAEIVIKARISTVTSKAESADFRDSIGLCADRLLAQAKKHHDRLAKERKRQGKRASVRFAALPAAPVPAASPGNDRPPVVRMGRIPAKPMSVEEAVLQVKDSNDPFLVFRNAESQQLAVIFRRPDGRFGLVEEEA